jgi:hypothetical protein
MGAQTGGWGSDGRVRRGHERLLRGPCRDIEGFACHEARYESGRVRTVGGYPEVRSRCLSTGVGAASAAKSVTARAVRATFRTVCATGVFAGSRGESFRESGLTKGRRVRRLRNSQE